MLIPLAAVLIAALASASLALAGGGKAKINLRKTSRGMILANSKGWTLYEFSKDKRNTDNCVSFKNCISLWPPVTTTGKPVAGRGIKASLLGTISLANGKKQVTYAGHPLYKYKFDGGPGMTFYIGKFQAGGRWYALRANGHKVK